MRSFATLVTKQDRATEKPAFEPSQEHRLACLIPITPWIALHGLLVIMNSKKPTEMGLAKQPKATSTSP